ncbi:hypothetical protein CYY_002729 [Polysphondylium violaceum]|uniref:Complex 1 LYR protein domain-containing protein n=1 Tax=Polysphondylium violaceum TaxID=133409 RepID=A0A8J4V203_9MYCE|nr:hypothetical protein CYY_002729 [Polysphondylium violaceum]
MATTSRKEAIRLYRDIIRTLRPFTHTNEQGIMWKDILKESTRKEYEMAKYETDATRVVQLIMVGRDCLMRIQEGMFTGKVNQDAPPPDDNPFTRI